MTSSALTCRGLTTRWLRTINPKALCLCFPCSVLCLPCLENVPLEGHATGHTFYLHCNTITLFVYYTITLLLYYTIALYTIMIHLIRLY